MILRNMSLILAALAVLLAIYGLGFWPNTARLPADQWIAARVPIALQPKTDSDIDVIRSDYFQFQTGPSDVRALLIDGDDAWIGGSRGAIRHRISDGDRLVVDNRTGLLANTVLHLAKIKGRIWAGTFGGGLSARDPSSGAWRTYNIPDGMADGFVFDTLAATNGDIWIATLSGVNRVAAGEFDRNESWQMFSAENTSGGLPSNRIHALAEGHNGEIWLATAGGLARFAEGKWRNWKFDQNSDDERRASGVEAPPPPHHPLQNYPHGSSNVAALNERNYLVALAVDGLGRVWCGTWGAGIAMYDGANWVRYTQGDGLPSNHVFALKLDHNDELWIGTNRGLAHHDNGRFKRYDERHGLYSDVVFTLAFADNGDLWVGGVGGVSRFPNGLRPRAALSGQ